MDNDILIDQARQLYVNLHIKLARKYSNRVERLLLNAYRRYQRRLNRCVLCYLKRNFDCIREPGKKLVPCPRRDHSNQRQKWRSEHILSS